MSKGITNRKKGHKAEIDYAKIFREELGFSFCKTSRYASRILDDAKVDLAFLPFNIQIKAGYNKSLNISKILDGMKQTQKKLFPPYDEIHKKANIIIQKKNVGRGNKRKETDELVFLTKKDFQNLFPNSLVQRVSIRKGQMRGWSPEEDFKDYDAILWHNKDKEIVIIIFEKFKTLIKKEKWQ